MTWYISWLCLDKSLCIVYCRLRGKNKTSGGIPGKPLEKKKSEKTLDRQQSRLNRTTPFHRRNQMMEEYVQYDMDMFMPRVPVSSVVGLAPSGPQVSAAGGTPGQQMTQGPPSTDATNVCSANIESPASNAPSPLEDSHNHSQMENATSMDPTMPTLSPHPPVLKTSEKDSTVPKISHIDPTISQNVNVNNSAVLVNGVTSDTNAFHKPHTVLKQENNAVSQPVTWAQQSLESTKANINSWLRSQQKQVDHKSFKRPCLPTMGADNDELVTMSLYNFDSVSSW